MAQRGFVTSDDGPHVYQYLDGLTMVFGTLLAGIPTEAITNLLINIRDGHEATAWINAQPTHMTVVPRQSMAAGEIVTPDQLAQIGEVQLEGIDPEPAHGATVYVCRVGWRVGMYFDFSMTRAEPNRPIDNLRAIAGQVHTLLTLRERLLFNDATLRTLYERGWFPFIGLPSVLLTELYGTAVNNWPVDDVEKKIVAAVSPRVPAMVETWKGKATFLPVIRRLTDAARLFAQGEHEASHAMALPIIEGVLRFMYLGKNRGHPDYKALRNAMVRESFNRTRGRSALLPEQFSEFLDTYYLAPFDLGSGQVPTSRHSLLHGVAGGDELRDPSHALRVFLTLEQLFFYV